MRSYFPGPHFDWGAPFSVGDDALELNLDLSISMRTTTGCQNRTAVTVEPIRGAARLYSSGSNTATVQRLLKHEHMQRFLELTALNDAFMRHLDGCLLRYLLAPTQRLDDADADGAAAPRGRRPCGWAAGVVHEPADHHPLLVHRPRFVHGAHCSGHAGTHDAHA